MSSAEVTAPWPPRPWNLISNIIHSWLGSHFLAQVNQSLPQYLGKIPDNIILKNKSNINIFDKIYRAFIFKTQLKKQKNCIRNKITYKLKPTK
jgi:hypothetical protein